MVDFPNNPSDGQTHSESGTTWVYRDPPKSWHVTTGSGVGGGIIWLPEVDLPAEQGGETENWVDVSVPEESTEIHVMWMGVSSNGPSSPCVRLGSGGVVETSGYTTKSWQDTSASTHTDLIGQLTMGFQHYVHNASGNFVFRKTSGNRWQGYGVGFKSSSNSKLASFGFIELPGPLDTVRLACSGIPNIFDEGTAMVGYAT